MIVPSGAVRVLVATRPVDLRKGWPRHPCLHRSWSRLRGPVVRAKRSVNLGWLRDVLRAVRAATEIAVPAGMRVLVATRSLPPRRR